MLLEPRSRFYLRHELRFRTPRNAGVPLPFRSADGKLDLQGRVAVEHAPFAHTARLSTARLRAHPIVHCRMLDSSPEQSSLATFDQTRASSVLAAFDSVGSAEHTPARGLRLKRPVLGVRP
jgi:hypothetical protein